MITRNRPRLITLRAKKFTFYIFARELADKVCFLDNGYILEEGPPDFLFSNPAKERTREFLARVL